MIGIVAAQRVEADDFSTEIDLTADQTMGTQRGDGEGMPDKIDDAQCGGAAHEGHDSLGRQVPVFLIESCLKVTPPSCRTPIGQSAGASQSLLAGEKSESRFRRRLNTLRHVISGSLAFVSSRRT